jgi:hypothetical protein
MQPTPQEIERRNQVMAQILQDIQTNTTIRLPDFNPAVSRPSDEFALLSIGAEPNHYGGEIGNMRYQFEGEEDLLHLFIVKIDQSEITPQESQAVVDLLWPGIPTALMWFKAGKKSGHYYLGHDVLLEYLT